MPLICVPLRSRSQKEVLKKWKALRGKTDLVELWLDEIADLDLPAILKLKYTPVLCRGRRAQEAGRIGADYIDLPFRGAPAPRLTGGQARTRAKLILSYHNRRRTPPYPLLKSKALAMRRAGAGIVKIAVLARSFSDTMEVIFLAQELQSLRIPHILIAMGKYGALSRVLTPHLGGTLMFAPLRQSESTAPGQLTVRQLRAAWNKIKSQSPI